jgi:hypothetical protein
MNREIIWLNDNYGNPTPCYKSDIKPPSVSAILDLIIDPEFEQFVRDVGEEKAKEIREAAANRGKSFHTFTENFIKELALRKDRQKALLHTLNVSPSLLEKENIPNHKIAEGRDLFYNFFYSDYSTRYVLLIGTELPVYSPILFYRGKLDVLYDEPGCHNVITDFKAYSKEVVEGSVKEIKIKRQLGAYALALEHMKNIKVTKASILAVIKSSSSIQEIICEGKELEEQKMEFEKLVRKWHELNGQNFLFDGENN